ncbi:MAG: GWxTD domain-containing protein [Acidobacteriota bacterium]|nr:GWxTD domain-containing protein [Acidobacteriota bacterium]
MKVFRGLVLSTLVLGWVACNGNADAHAQQPSGVTQAPVTPEKPDPLKRRLTDKERIKQQKDLRGELHGVYKTWLDQDVVWIITDTERQAFKHLSNDEERDAFIENFWLRRNPNPDSPDNEFREEHYARIAYANEHFPAGKPGWMTDRGHVYIAFGKPDDIESHPSGGQYERPMEEGGGNTATFPFEIWHYRYLEGIGDNINLEFVDTCQCGDYHFTIDRSEKDALKMVPGAGLTQAESMGMAEKKDRFSHGGLEQLGTGPGSTQNQTKQFDRIELEAKIMAPPPIKFHDMEEFMTNAKVLTGPPFPFDVRADWVKVTNDTVIVPVTLQMRTRDITFNTKEGVSTGKVNILGRVSNMVHKPVVTFEDTVEVSSPSELLEAVQKGSRIYWKSLPLRPGMYKLDIVIKDVNNPDHVGRFTQALSVPKYDDDTLGHSSLILADEMWRVSSKEIGAGNFVLGDTHVRPRVSSSPAIPVAFTRSQNLNFWMQVYNLQIDEKSKQNNATIEYRILDLGTNKAVLDTEEPASKLSPNAEQLTLEKTLPLSSLQPGNYQVSVIVKDLVNGATTQESKKFVLN